jgi:general secretion pathway protein D
MRRFLLILNLAAGLVGAAAAQQQPPPPPPPPAIAPSVVVGSDGKPPQQPPPARPAQPAQPAQAKPQAPAPTTQPAAPQTVAHTTSDGGFVLDTDTTLTELITILARQMKLNYILDPRVGKGSVSIHTYGEVKPIAMMPLLMTVLRVNGATMVQVGDLYRIIPINEVSKLPIEPIQNPDPKTLPDDERMVMNMVFLKYAMASEMKKLLDPFMGEGATSSIYEPANLMIIEDNSRSMRRTMELLAMFDSDTFAGQRVRLFDVNNSRPSDLVKDLDSVFKAYSLSDKTAVKFIAVDRINTLIAVAPNPGVFDQVKKWIEKLDIPVKSAAGGINNYVYRLKYGDAASVAMAIMALYSGNPMALLQMSAMANSGMYAAGMGLNGTGGMGMGGYGMGGYGMGGMGGYGMGGMGGYGMGGMGGYGMGGMGGYGMGGYGGYGSPYGSPYMSGMVTPTGSNGVAPTAPAASSAATGGVGQTGQYLTPGTTGAAAGAPRMPHIIPNPFDNTLLIQGTDQEYQQILDLLRQLDVPPRQVLIDAKIYEVDLTEDLSAGVESYLQKVNSGAATGSTGTASSGGGLTPSRALAATAGAAGLGLTTGALVLRSSELLATLQASESRGKAKVISSPSIIATDSVQATMNVGTQVPVLTSQAVAGGVQSGGSSVFTNTVSNQSSGVTLSILAHVNSSGMVTLLINQQVSAPQPPAASSAIQSPSFTNRSVSTQVMVQDGDTVAIGGAILEDTTESSSGVPFLHRIPIIGAAFGAKSYSTQRTELIIFLTPRVIYDPSQIIDATDEIRSNLKRVGKLMKDDQ